MNLLFSGSISLLTGVALAFAFSFSIPALVSAAITVIAAFLIIQSWTPAESNAKKASGAIIAFSFVTGLLSLLIVSLPTEEPVILLSGILVLAFAAAKLTYYGLDNQRPAKSQIQHPAPAMKMSQPAEEPSRGFVKILDTSIVIDGRIIDIATTGFLEGPFVIPNFVLREVQLISDSQDPIKRNRGRRGLEMLNELQKRDDLEVKIEYKDYTDTREVDAKLVKLAMDLGGKLITNDYNLNKVAELQGIEVLNMNNLANSLKPVVLPGEEMEFLIVKEGKDDNQGVGYLDDGTMVIVENGGKLIGKKVKVAVTSVLQTNAGKLIFTKPLNAGSNQGGGNNNGHRNQRRERQEKVQQNS